jgi:putative membrane protein
VPDGAGPGTSAAPIRAFHVEARAMPSPRQKKTIICLMCVSGCALVWAAPPLARSADAAPTQPSHILEGVSSEDPKDFYEAAASVNMLEIEAGKLARRRSSDADVRAFAAKMVEDHTEAGQRLGKLATSKKQVLPTQLLKRDQMMLDGLKEAQDGAEFDEAYRTRMVIAHEQAVTLFDHASKKSPDPEIRAFAARMLPRLREHGAHARKLEASAKDAKPSG